MKFEELKQQMLEDDNFREEYYKKDLQFQVSQMIFDARMMRGVTQKELAKKVGTKQPSIARIENGTNLPSLSFLEKIAVGLETYLVPPVFGFMKGYHDEVYNSSEGSEMYKLNTGNTVSISVGIISETTPQVNLKNRAHNEYFSPMSYLVTA